MDVQLRAYYKMIYNGIEYKLVSQLTFLVTNLLDSIMYIV